MKLPTSFPLRGFVSLTLIAFAMKVTATVHYVDLNCTNATLPYTNWPTAATNIQDAIDAATDGDEIVVTNGVYETGAQAVYGMSNRVAVTKPLVVRSVNGPEATVIEGYQVPGTTNGPEAIRCVYLTNGAVLIGFTLTNGATQTSGDQIWNQSSGGVWCESVSVVVSNCVVTGNSAVFRGGGSVRGTLYNCTLSGNSAGVGGGAYSSTLYYCTLSGNSASQASVSGWGGGAALCKLYNSTLSGNSAYEGGGAWGCDLGNCTVTGNSANRGGGVGTCTLNNCIVYYNTASSGTNWHCNGCCPCFGRYNCTTPLFGPGDIVSEPLLLDTNGWSNLRLQSNSPCINAGTNGFVSWTTDLDGNPRIVGGTVDMGAYECQSPALLNFYLWLESYGQPTRAGSEYIDLDGDLMNNWQEWRADTNPTNALSVLRMVTATNGPSGLDVTWQSVSARSYWLECATNLGDVPAFQIIATNIAGASGTTTYADTSATNGGPYLYRVGVQ